MNKQKRLCKTCANLDGDECKVMLARPTELWCWADIKTQRMREMAILKHLDSGAYTGKTEPRTVQKYAQVARENLKWLRAKQEAEDAARNTE